MNKPAKSHKIKGISVDGFWDQLKSKTEKKPSETNCRDSRELSDANPETHTDSCNLSDPNTDSRDVPELHCELHDDWIASFDDWLDRL